MPLIRDICILLHPHRFATSCATIKKPLRVFMICDEKDSQVFQLKKIDAVPYHIL